MKTLISILASALLCACCAGVSVCPKGDDPLPQASNMMEVRRAIAALIETCLPPKDKSMMVSCDQVYIERLVQAANENEVQK